MCNREEAILSDLWVLKYIWETEEQIEVLEGIINNCIENDITENSHPQALYNKAPNPEELIKEIETLKEQLQGEALSFEEQNIIKDKLRFIQSRTDWISNLEQKEYIESAINAIWQSLLQAL